MTERILIISASMGAGHDGAARELAGRIEEQGHSTQTVDFLKCASGAGGLIKRVYEFQLSQAPWSYEALYRVFFKMPSLYRPLVWLTTFLSSRAIRRHIKRFDATCIVTTYPLASLTIGKERQRGRITIPAITFVTDFAVHPLWVHPGVDLNLTVHQSCADAAFAATNKPSFAPGPMVPARFSAELPGRDDARRQLGIPLDATVPLVVAGSWGVGELDATLNDLMNHGGYFPVVACGSNEKLRETLAAKAGDNALILGWTDQMPALMAASDVLLQNAGGLTCMEAFAAGLPVVTFRPIPGHGIENAIAMEEAGVAPYARDACQLAEVLGRATTLAGRSAARTASTMFAGNAAWDVIALTTAWDVHDIDLFDDADSIPDDIDAAGIAADVRSNVIALRRRNRIRRVGRVSAALAIGYASVNVAAAAAVAHGVDVAKPTAGNNQIYVGVRIGPSALDNAALPSTLSSNGVTAILSGHSFQGHRTQVDQLASAGVDLANGGWSSSGGGIGLMFHNANVSKGSHAIASDTGTTPSDYVPTQSVNGLDLSAARLSHEKIVRPTALVTVGMTIPTLKSGDIIVIDGSNATGIPIENTISVLIADAQQDGVSISPLSDLH